MAVSACSPQCGSTPYHQMGRADNECAEALLELAMSVSPPHPVTTHSFHSPPEEVRTYSQPSPNEKRHTPGTSSLADFINCALQKEAEDQAKKKLAHWNEVKRRAVSVDERDRMVVKRIKLEHNYSLVAPETWNSDCTDSKAHSSSQDKMSASTISWDQNLHDDIDISLPSGYMGKKQAGLKWNKENNFANGIKIKTEVSSPDSVPIKESPAVSRVSPKSRPEKAATEKKAVKRNPSAKKTAKNNAVKEEPAGKGKKSPAPGSAKKKAVAKKKPVVSMKTVKESKADSCNMSVLAGGVKESVSSKAATVVKALGKEGNDERFKGFHLLLKCLAEKEEDDAKQQLSQQAIKEETSDRLFEMKGKPSMQGEAPAAVSPPAVSSSTPDLPPVIPQVVAEFGESDMEDWSDSETESEEETGLNLDKMGGMPDMFFKCGLCSKTFSKKRYLTKHARRMHPGFSLAKIQEEAAIACPHCLKVISKKNFKRHLGTCKVASQHWSQSWEQDTATCQFCHVKLKRHMLVRHLANKHCVERNVEMHIATSFLTAAEDQEDINSNYSKPSKRRLSREMSPTASDLTVCQLCSVLLPKNELEEHMATTHGCPPAEATSVQCAFCEQELRPEERLRHVQEAHADCLPESVLAQLRQATSDYEDSMHGSPSSSHTSSASPSFTASPSAPSPQHPGPAVAMKHGEVSSRLQVSTPTLALCPPATESLLMSQINQVYGNPSTPEVSTPSQASPPAASPVAAGSSAAYPSLGTMQESLSLQCMTAGLQSLSDACLSQLNQSRSTSSVHHPPTTPSHTQTFHEETPVSLPTQGFLVTPGQLPAALGLQGQALTSLSSPMHATASKDNMALSSQVVVYPSAWLQTNSIASQSHDTSETVPNP